MDVNEEVVREVRVGATRKKLIYQLKDENGAAINITGFTIRLQGKSADLPAVEIDQAGTIIDAPNGKVQWKPSTLVTSTNLLDAQKRTALFDLTVKITDLTPESDFIDPEDNVLLRFLQDPLIP